MNVIDLYYSMGWNLERLNIVNPKNPCRLFHTRKNCKSLDLSQEIEEILASTIGDNGWPLADIFIVDIFKHIWKQMDGTQPEKND